MEITSEFCNVHGWERYLSSSVKSIASDDKLAGTLSSYERLAQYGKTITSEFIKGVKFLCYVYPKRLYNRDKNHEYWTATLYAGNIEQRFILYPERNRLISGWLLVSARASLFLKSGISRNSSSHLESHWSVILEVISNGYGANLATAPSDHVLGVPGPRLNYSEIRKEILFLIASHVWFRGSRIDDIEQLRVLRTPKDFRLIKGYLSWMKDNAEGLERLQDPGEGDVRRLPT